MAVGNVDRDGAIDALVRFARLVSDAEARREILPLLADAIQLHVRSGGVCVVAIAPGGEASVAEARGLPPALASLPIDPDAMGEELGSHVLSACGGSFAHAETRRLVAGGNLFGAVVILFGEREPSPIAMQLADGLVDLAASRCESAEQIAKLERSNEELRASRDVLARTGKLRALGQMAAGLSRDLKNILNPLSLHLQFAERAIARGQLAEARESIVEMKGVVVRGVEILERLRSYSRQTKEGRPSSSISIG